MANYVYTRVRIESNEDKLHTWLQESFREKNTGLTNDGVRNTIENVFGEYEEYPWDEVGSKWIYVEDAPWIRDNDIEMTFVSAWSFPSGYVEKFISKLVEYDENVKVWVEADEESLDFLVGGYGNKNGFIFHDTDVLPDYPEDLEDEGYEDLQSEFWERCGEEIVLMQGQSERELNTGE